MFFVFFWLDQSPLVRGMQGMGSRAYEGGNSIGGGDPGRERMESETVITCVVFVIQKQSHLRGVTWSKRCGTGVTPHHSEFPNTGDFQLLNYCQTFKTRGFSTVTTRPKAWQETSRKCEGKRPAKSKNKYQQSLRHFSAFLKSLRWEPTGGLEAILLPRPKSVCVGGWK